MPPQPLPPEALYRRVATDALAFETTADLPPLDEPVAQPRAVEAIRFAIGVRSDGYNLYALGPNGTGKSSIVRQFLGTAAAAEPVPDDWCYVNNFEEANRPRALRLPPGRGQTLRRDMERLVDELRLAIPALFESEEYQARRQGLEAEFKQRQDHALKELRQEAEERGVALIRTPMGMALAPLKDGEVLSPEEFHQLPEEEQTRRQQALQELQERLEETLKHMPRWEREHRDKLRALDQEVTASAVGHLIDELREAYADLPAVLEYLDAVKDDVVRNAGEFLPRQQEEGPLPAALRGERDYRRYRVNVLVDNGGLEGAPVVREDHPTQPNLIGRTEYVSQFGALATDFNLIRAGALHRANGGYLMLEAHKLLMQPFAWDDLKRALKAGEIRIESPGQSMGLLSTTTLEPEPIPLSVKVVLTGEPMLYYLLSHYDPEFPELFKVAADFDYEAPRDEDNVSAYARLIGTFARQEGLKPLHREAVARVIEHAGRLAGDADKLSTHMASLSDLVREAHYFASQDGAEAIARAHVEQAIQAQDRRSDRVREHIQEDMRRGTLMIDTDGAVVGQINGLSVMQLGRFAFGRPTRITCRVRLGKGEVVDIEREVQLGGPLHSKGVLILSSFLSARYAAEVPLSLAATLVFEQSYGGIEGDSASSTELYALLSALAEAPIRQSLAVTGSVNQRGQIQAIGGVNEKIEGFFDLCRARGLDGSHGVIIPKANARHLMLRPDVVEAAEQGRFHIYAVETVDEGIELLTGIPAGAPDENGQYPPGTINRRVQHRLLALARRARELSQPAEAGNNRMR